MTEKKERKSRVLGNRIECTIAVVSEVVWVFAVDDIKFNFFGCHMMPNLDPDFGRKAHESCHRELLRLVET